MASILKVDKIRGTGLDSDTISFDGTGNITIPKNVTFSGTVSGDNNSIVKLLDVTISTSIARYDIDSTYINSTYDEYLIFFVFKQVTDDRNMFMRVFVGGSLVTSTVYAYEVAASSSSTYTGNNSTTEFRLNNTAVGNDTGEAYTGRLHIQNVNSTSFPFVYSGYGNSFSAGGNHLGQSINGSLKPSNASDVVNGLSFHGGSNISSGTVKLYGIK